MFELVILVPPRTARLGLAAALVCLLGQRSISDDTDYNNFYGSASGAYSGAVVTGVNPGGAARDTPLATNGGAVMRVGTNVTNAGSANGAAVYSDDPLVAVGRGVPATGVDQLFNALPAGPGTGSAGIYSSGANSGVSVDDGGGGSYRLYPLNGLLQVGYNNNGNLFSFSATGFGGFCVPRTTSFPSTTQCLPPHTTVIGSGAATNPTGTGTMYCCQLELKTW